MTSPFLLILCFSLISSRLAYQKSVCIHAKSVKTVLNCNSLRASEQQHDWLVCDKADDWFRGRKGCDMCRTTTVSKWFVRSLITSLSVLATQQAVFSERDFGKPEIAAAVWGKNPWVTDTNQYFKTSWLFLWSGAVKSDWTSLLYEHSSL